MLSQIAKAVIQMNGDVQMGLNAYQIPTYAMAVMNGGMLIIIQIAQMALMNFWKHAAHQNMITIKS